MNTDTTAGPPGARTSAPTGGARPGLAAWLTPPANRWAVKHARELFPSERVGAGSASPLQDSARPLALDATLASYLDRSFTDAFVVLHGGSVALEWYAPGGAPEDRHVLFSVTKSVVGLVAAALVAEGAIEETASVATYVPETADGGYGTARVRHLLDMTANVRFVEDYDGPDVRRFREASGQIPSPRSEGIHTFAAGLPAVGPHGKAFHYVSPTADVAGWVCERATGRTLGELISRYVWRPMGAEHDADLLLDRHGAPRASGGLCGTARDMARIGQLLLDHGHDGGSAPGVADVTTPGDAAAWATGDLAYFLEGAAYRSFWYQPAGDPEVLLAAGIHGQRIYVDQRRHVVIAQQASLPRSFDEQTWSETLPTFRRVARAVAGG